MAVPRGAGAGSLNIQLQEPPELRGNTEVGRPGQ